MKMGTDGPGSRGSHSGYCPDCQLPTANCRLPTSDSSVAQKPSINRQSTVSTVSVSAEAEERRTRGRKEGKEKAHMYKKNTDNGQRTRRAPDSRLQTPDSAQSKSKTKKRITFFSLPFGLPCIRVFQPPNPTRSFESDASKTAKQQNSKQQTIDPTRACTL